MPTDKDTVRKRDLERAVRGDAFRIPFAAPECRALLAGKLSPALLQRLRTEFAVRCGRRSITSWSLGLTPELIETKRPRLRISLANATLSRSKRCIT